MLTARLLRQPVLRLIAFSIIFAAVITVAVSFATRPALACPEPPPQPLRHLYVQSDQIVVATVGKTEVVKVENPEAAVEEQMSQLKTALHVSSTLKGETKPVIYLSHWRYSDYPDALSNDVDGKTFLLFLNLNAEDETYSIDDMSYGAKQLSDANLKIYIKRIEELAGILSAEKPSDKEIVEWLVRCAEEPATRWEGAYELVTSSYLLEYQEEQAKARAAQAEAEAAASSSDETSEEAKTGVASEGETASSESESHEEEAEYNPYGAHVKAEFIGLLTDEQKYRLTTALVNIERLKDADSVLVEVVKRWDDARLVPYLLSQLRHTDEESPYLTENLMMIVARKIGDEALIAQVEKFSTMENEETGEGDGMAEAVEETGEQAVEEATEESAEASESEQTAAQEEAEKAANAVRQQKRKRMLEHFITLAESAVPKPVEAQAANTSTP